MAPRLSDAAGSPVNAFQVGDVYLCKHYFEGDAVFARLRHYYYNTGYRFVVPTSEFDGVQRFLADHGYALQPVTSLEEYAVVVRKYTAHPAGIFKRSVHQFDHGDHTVFLLKDRDAVDEMTEAGATPLADSPLSMTLDGQQRLSAAVG